jgi:hypothetical protein
VNEDEPRSAEGDAQSPPSVRERNRFDLRTMTATRGTF